MKALKFIFTVMVCAFPFVLLAVPMFDTVTISTHTYASGMTGLELFKNVAELVSANTLSWEIVSLVVFYSLWMLSSACLLVWSVVELFSKRANLPRAIDAFTIANYILYFIFVVMHIIFVGNFISTTVEVAYSIAMLVGMLAMPVLSVASLRKFNKFCALPIMLLFTAHLIVFICLFV